MRTFAIRLVQAATLDPKIYDACVENRRLVWPALIVVVASGVAGVLGQHIGRDFESAALLEDLLRKTLVWTASWPVLAGVTYAVGRWLLGGEGTFGGVFRGIGWAFTPGLLQVAMALPPLNFVAYVVAIMWIISLGAAATSRTLRVSSTRAMFAILAAWGVWALVGAMVMVAQGTFPSWTG